MVDIDVQGNDDSSVTGNMGLAAILDDTASYESEVLRLSLPCTEELLHQQLRADAVAVVSSTLSALPSPSSASVCVPSLASSAASRSSYSLDSPVTDPGSLSGLKLNENLKMLQYPSISDYVGPPPSAPDSPLPASSAVSIPQYDSLGRLVKLNPKSKRSSAVSTGCNSVEVKPKKRSFFGRLWRDTKSPVLKATTNLTSEEDQSGPASPAITSSFVPAKINNVAWTPFQVVALSQLEQSPDMLEEASRDKAFMEIQDDAESENERFIAYEKKLHETLTRHFHETRMEMKTLHAQRLRTARDQHSSALEELEERQVLLEHQLRTAQIEETQNVHTALKYMEGYCSGLSSPNRTVTQEDFSKLAAQRKKAELLSTRHEGAINILRQKQERFVKARKQKQVQELAAVDTEFLDKMKRLHEQEEVTRSKLTEIMNGRRERLLERWEHKIAIWRSSIGIASPTLSDATLLPSPTTSPTLKSALTSAPELAFPKFKSVDWWSKTTHIVERPHTAVA